MRLDLRFSDRSLENIWCQAVTGFSFYPPDLETSGLENLDMKMSGMLSDLIAKRRWTGERGESFLLSSQGTIPAEKILFYGLGTISDFNVEILKGSVQSLGYALNKLAVNDFSIYLPLIEGFENEYTIHVEHSVPALVQPFFEAHETENEFFLKIVYCVNQEMIHLIAPIVDRLRDYFLSFMECSIIIGYEAKREASAA
jgi:hypothetical protein